MKLQFINPEVRAGKKYKGEIARYTVDEERRVLRVYVILEQEPQVEFMKRFELDQNVGSAFAMFCCDMQIYMDDDTVDLDDMEGLKVKVKLKKGRDEKLYIEEIKLDEKFYETQYEEG